MVRLSNKAPPWNSMPNFFITRSRSRWLIPTTSSPSIRIEPLSGRIRPSMHFSVTDLPLPDPPMITIDSVWAMSSDTPSSTVLGPKDLCRSMSWILGWVMSLLEEEGGYHIIEEQDQDRGRHHRIGGGLTDALGAALGMVAVIAAEDGHHQPE